MSKIRFDLDDFTLDDMDDFETWTGMSIDEAFTSKPVMGSDGKPVRDERGRPMKAPRISAKALKAIVTIVKRREDPSFSFEDAGKVKITELEIAGDSDPEGDDAATKS